MLCSLTLSMTDKIKLHAGIKETTEICETSKKLFSANKIQLIQQTSTFLMNLKCSVADSQGLNPGSEGTAPRTGLSLCLH